ncbi:MAG: 50S ribosomal protein L17 [Actinomycetes bacterium]
MRHGRHGKKLGRDSAHRKALYSNLAGALIEHGRIKTTVTKAKAVKPIAEQMITLGRRGDIHARRQAVAFLRSKAVVHKLFTEVAPRFAQRPGGYSRIVKIGPRAGDCAEMAYLELVDTPLVFKTKLEDVPDDVQATVEESAVSADAEADDIDAEAVIADAEAIDEEAVVEDDAASDEPVAHAELSADAADADATEPAADGDSKPDA